MLQRIGEKKSKKIGVMDLTSGYHQTPLSFTARLFTAFITLFGLFHWLRVPMGLKGSGSYFQRTLASVVLAGILYFACELYIDDILVCGKTHEEFLRNLELVFERLKKHKITLNPTKCTFGTSSVEYVGHTISEEGLNYSPEKREAVFNIKKPMLEKQLKSFIGCAEYFHEHIQNFSTIMRPLHKLVTAYEKTAK